MVLCILDCIWIEGLKGGIKIHNNKSTQLVSMKGFNDEL